jgi:hypothetical protein
MEADSSSSSALEQEAARLVGRITAWSIALRVAVKANPRAAELRGRVDDIRRRAREGLGKFHGEAGFDGVESVIRDLERLLGILTTPFDRAAVAADVPQDPTAAIGRMVGTGTALQVALQAAVQSNPLARELRARLDDVREAAIGQIIGADVADEVFEGIDFAIDEVEEMLPPSAAR